MFTHRVRPETWTAPNLSTLPSWKGVKRLAIDVETRDSQLTSLGPGVRRGAYIVGVSFAIEGGASYYLPLRHAAGDNVADVQAAIRYLRDNAAAFDGELVGANLQYDLDFLEEEGIVFPLAKWKYDIQVADWLINEMHPSYALDAICTRWGVPNKNEHLLRDAASAYGVDAKKGLYLLPGSCVEAYAIGDVLRPLEILRKQEIEIAAQRLHRVWALESKLLPVLLKMRRRGVRIDTDHLQVVEDKSHLAIRECLEQVRLETGCVIHPDQIMSAPPLLEALRKIGVGMDADGVDKGLLESNEHPVCKALARARRWAKVQSTYVNAIRKHMVKGRIHGSFTQGLGSWGGGDDKEGAAYGRLASRDPNLQNQPSRDEEIGKFWRKIYLPEEGQKWISADYSKQEPRVLTHFAIRCGCRGAAEFGRNFDNPDFDLYVGFSKLTGTDYKATKILYLGLSYAMGGAKLCRGVKKPTIWKPNREGKMQEYAGDEGQAIIDRFHNGAPFIKELNYATRDRVQEVGYLVTLSGRRCRFPLKSMAERAKTPDKPYDYAHLGTNRIVQGSAGDQTKQALVDIDAAGKYLQLQIHDETAGSTPGGRDAEEWGEIQRDSIKLMVSNKVDVELGDSWGHSMEKH